MMLESKLAISFWVIVFLASLIFVGVISRYG